ncbi:unnamed protein product [Leptosia nina]|uniref:beta-glucosidase n=1 Tax=Leptosia nina TaxID=320188 RepID=A0AAV1J557_9NEOP
MVSCSVPPLQRTKLKELGMSMFCHYVHPIFSKNGDFPEVVKRRVAAKSLEQGFFRSRLPELTKEEVNYLRGTADMLGLNHYITNLAYKNKSAIFSTDGPSWRNDHEVITFQLDEWKIGDSNRTRLVPWGFYKMLNRIKADFGNPPIFVTENGFSSHGGLYDDDRVIYYKSYLHAMLDAIDDGVNVVAYSAWSLMDNFEWIQGFTERFGLYEVDFNSTLRIRTPRKSAYVYKEIVRTRYLDLSFEPDLAQPMMIDQGH